MVAEGLSRVTVQGKTPVAIELMLVQYRTSRIEEIVTRNVFRIVWFMLSVYVSAVLDVNYADLYDEASAFFSLLQPLGLVLVASVLYFISRGATEHVRRQSETLRKLLVSSDRELKDSYVEEFYMNEMTERAEYPVSRRLTRREDILWFGAVVSILYLRLASVLLPL